MKFYFLFFIQIFCTLCNVLYLFSKQSERRGHKNVVINFLFFYGFSYSISTALHLFEVIPPTYGLCTCINKSIDCRITVETTIIPCFIFCPLHFYSQTAAAGKYFTALGSKCNQHQQPTHSGCHPPPPSYNSHLCLVNSANHHP